MMIECLAALHAHFWSFLPWSWVCILNLTGEVKNVLQTTTLFFPWGRPLWQIYGQRNIVFRNPKPITTSFELILDLCYFLHTYLQVPWNFNKIPWIICILNHMLHVGSPKSAKYIKYVTFMCSLSLIGYLYLSDIWQGL